MDAVSFLSDHAMIPDDSNNKCLCDKCIEYYCKGCQILFNSTEKFYIEKSKFRQFHIENVFNYWSIDKMSIEYYSRHVII